MGVFDRYAPFVQDFIYAHEWENLRSVQVAAGEAIFDTDDHVLLCASTASGKTEAAFFPILTEFWENPPASVGALYIGPTKALINDQFNRLTDLCEEAGINVWHWHGDVSASHKARLVRRPSGILQITPESLEALLMRRHAVVSKLFCDLRYVVIDEVHSLLRQDRGGQCLCLIERLARIAGVRPRRIGLSATIGDPEAVGAFLAAGTGRDTVVPRIEEPPRAWRLSGRRPVRRVVGGEGTIPVLKQLRRKGRACRTARGNSALASRGPYGPGARERRPGHRLHLRAHAWPQVPDLLELARGGGGGLHDAARLL